MPTAIMLGFHSLLWGALPTYATTCSAQKCEQLGQTPSTNCAWWRAQCMATPLCKIPSAVQGACSMPARRELTTVTSSILPP